MTRAIRLLGSLRIAVLLLVAIAIVLAWGTIYEARYGSAAVQRFIYHAWWFQALLGFLAFNLLIAAITRYPFRLRQLPFLLAHFGIILILLGAILGSRFGIEGQLVISEGQAERVLQLPRNVLVVREPDSGAEQVMPTMFETTSWVREPGMAFDVSIRNRSIQLIVDRYYPDAVMEEEITDDGTADNPAIRVAMRHGEHEEELWLLARDTQRSSIGWGQAHLLFLEPKTQEQVDWLFSAKARNDHARGAVSIMLLNRQRPYEIPVPETMGKPVSLAGTPYVITFSKYMPDFAITEAGPVSRSEAPNNPAVSFTLSGPEGTDEHLLFALYPDFASLHGRQQLIDAKLNYQHEQTMQIAPQAINLIRLPQGTLAAVVTGELGQRQEIRPLETGTYYIHPWLDYQFGILAYYPRANMRQKFVNRSNELRSEALHVTLREGKSSAEAWLGLRSSAEIALGEKLLVVQYRPDSQELPVTIKLLDFRKIDYPGSQMAAGFESDVQLTDSQRGIILMRKISMNNPLRYRQFSFFQSSYIPGEVETTVLAVKSDPGTPFVYAGFVVIIAGMVFLFYFRQKPKRKKR
jgi:hypothetical protein